MRYSWDWDVLRLKAETDEENSALHHLVAVLDRNGLRRDEPFDLTDERNRAAEEHLRSMGITGATVPTPPATPAER